MKNNNKKSKDIKEDELWKKAPKQKLTAKSLIKDFLENLWFAIGAGAEHFGERTSTSDIFNTRPKYFKYSKSEYSRLMSNCKRDGYLNIKNIKGQKSIEFTDKAKIKIIDKISEQKKIDGKFRFVSFDVPEDMKSSRNKFRRAIKKMGFRQIQKSLWVLNRNVGELVEFASYRYGVEKYVIYIISERTDIDGIIEKKFKNTKSGS